MKKFTLVNKIDGSERDTLLNADQFTAEYDYTGHAWFETSDGHVVKSAGKIIAEIVDFDGFRFIITDEPEMYHVVAVDALLPTAVNHQVTGFTVTIKFEHTDQCGDEWEHDVFRFKFDRDLTENEFFRFLEERGLSYNNDAGYDYREVSGHGQEWEYKSVLAPRDYDPDALDEEEIEDEPIEEPLAEELGGPVRKE